MFLFNKYVLEYIDKRLNMLRQLLYLGHILDIRIERSNGIEFEVH